MSGRGRRAFELALALVRAREIARRLEAEFKRAAEPPRKRGARMGGVGTPAAGPVGLLPPPEPPPAEGDLIPIPPTEPPVEAAAPTESVASDLIPGLPERPLRRTEELPPLEPRPSSARPAMFHLRRESGARPADPARVAELRAAIAAGTYVPFALLRRAVGR